MFRTGAQLLPATPCPDVTRRMIPPPSPHGSAPTPGPFPDIRGQPSCRQPDPVRPACTTAIPRHLPATRRPGLLAEHWRKAGQIGARMYSGCVSSDRCHRQAVTSPQQDRRPRRSAEQPVFLVTVAAVGYPCPYAWPDHGRSRFVPGRGVAAPGRRRPPSRRPQTVRARFRVPAFAFITIPWK